MKLYLVTVGEYSDYRIVGVYTTKARARRIVRALNGGMVEPFIANETPNFIERGYFLWYVRMERNGSTRRAYAEEFDSHSVRDVGFRTTRIDIEHDRETAHIHCWARTKKAAIKIANELRAQKIANNEWLPPDPQRCSYLPPSMSYGPHVCNHPTATDCLLGCHGAGATEIAFDFWKTKV